MASKAANESAIHSHRWCNQWSAGSDLCCSCGSIFGDLLLVLSGWRTCSGSWRTLSWGCLLLGGGRSSGAQSRRLLCSSWRSRGLQVLSCLSSCRSGSLALSYGRSLRVCKLTRTTLWSTMSTGCQSSEPIGNAEAKLSGTRQPATSQRVYGS